jgi:hypothetical protein
MSATKFQMMALSCMVFNASSQLHFITGCILLKEKQQNIY